MRHDTLKAAAHPEPGVALSERLCALCTWARVLCTWVCQRGTHLASRVVGGHVEPAHMLAGIDGLEVLHCLSRRFECFARKRLLLSRRVDGLVRRVCHVGQLAVVATSAGCARRVPCVPKKVPSLRRGDGVVMG